MRAIISDIHANLPALEAVLADIDARGIRDILCLGDIVGYGAQPEECLTLMRTRGIPNILGNHDSYITTGQNCERSRVVAAIIDDHKTMISPQNGAWLGQSLSHVDEGATRFHHGGPDDPVDQYIYEVGPDLFPAGVTRLFAGHTHVQAVLTMGALTFCNPGSVGQPRDGDPRAAYAILDGADILLQRVPYDIARSVAAMQARGYEPFLYENLWNGAQIGGRVDRITLSRGDTPRT